MHMYIDIVGTCNLKCPSCPIGNSENNNYKKPMAIEKFIAITQKAQQEGIASIYLYNWTEPLIHPKVGEFISATESAGIRCGISSNLNTSKNLEQAIKANPSFFRISLSGFHQDVYSAGHTGGDIEEVKKNMVLLSELKLKYQAKTHIEVYYHRYLDNLDDEAKMEDFCKSLGFAFSTGTAIMMPLEKALAVTELDDSKISQKDKDIMQRMVLPPSPDVINLAQAYKNLPCHLKDGMLTLDARGNVTICCNVFEQKEYDLGNYLYQSLDEIQKNKNENKSCLSICERCTNKGLHVYYQNPPIFDEYAKIKLIEDRVKKIKKKEDFVLSIRSSQKIPGNEYIFDEKKYLEKNPDVKIAVANNVFQNGYDHYQKFGKFEKHRSIQ